MQDDLCTILNQFRKGKQLLDHFNKVGRLESKHRGHIVECIIEFYLKVGSGKIAREVFEKITEQIVHQFPCELKVRNILFNNK